jgi:hypothetical protein
VVSENHWINGEFALPVWETQRMVKNGKCWSLATGHWSLATGFWSLALSFVASNTLLAGGQGG